MPKLINEVSKGEERWIFPSEGFLDIRAGKVKVESIIRSEVAYKVFTEFDLEHYGETDKFVSYIYEEDGMREILPLEEFKNHTELV